jgi:hypothetical protein
MREIDLASSLADGIEYRADRFKMLFGGQDPVRTRRRIDEWQALFELLDRFVCVGQHAFAD